MLTVLASVTDKTGLHNFLRRLERFDELKLIATSSTAKHLNENGLTSIKVEELTGFPEILAGRVKTLHPKVFAGILARPSAEDRSCLEEMKIAEIDLVVVNLYKFEDKLKENLSEPKMVEEIDVGGVALLRAAAKNFERVAVVSDPKQYDEIIQVMDANGGKLPVSFRKKLAHAAFQRTASYDQSISSYLGQNLDAMSEAKVGTGQNSELPEVLNLNLKRFESLRYGENPHQAAAWYAAADLHLPGINPTAPKFPPFEQLQGKEMSSNNITDAYALVQILRGLGPNGVCIIKHNNPCGVAIGKDIHDAFEKAYDCDPISAFGGVYGFTEAVDAKLAERVTRDFVEIVLAPEIKPEALEIFKKKKNVRVLKIDTKKLAASKDKQWKLKHLTDFGWLLEVDQEPPVELKDFKCVTDKPFDPAMGKDVMFTWSVVRHLTSNAIFVAKDGLSLGIGIGQTSRIASAEIALRQAGARAKGAVMASEAFLPAIDNIQVAAKAGISVIIQPGGSIKDADVIAECNKAGITMLFTGQRCFKH